MRPNRLQKALKELGDAVQKVETLLKEMRSEHDPLAVHIFVSRREYRTMPDTKSGKRHQRTATTSWQEACHLGFRGELREWERLMDAVARR